MISIHYLSKEKITVEDQSTKDILGRGHIGEQKKGKPTQL